MYLYENHRRGEPVKLAQLSLQYKDFAHWQQCRAANSSESKESHRFWKEKVESGIPQLSLPRKIGGDNRDLSGAMYRFFIGEELMKSLKKLGESRNTTLFMVMFAAYVINLSRYANQKDIICSIISAGREHDSLYPVIGFFVNSIFFKIRLQENEGFDKLLQRVHDDVMECFTHQGYPLEKVFEEKRMRYPDIPVAFNMVNMQAAAGTVKRAATVEKEEPKTDSKDVESFSPYHRANIQDVKFDLEPYVVESEKGIDTQWAYKKSLFSPSTIEHFVKDYIKLLEFFAAQSNKKYGEFKTAGKKRKFNRNKG